MALYKLLYSYHYYYCCC